MHLFALAAVAVVIVVAVVVRAAFVLVVAVLGAELPGLAAVAAAQFVFAILVDDVILFVVDPVSFVVVFASADDVSPAVVNVA